MSNISLFAACVLIWGTTWLAITFQLGSVAPELFGGDVVVFSLDKESSRARGLPDVHELYIGYNQIEIEDLAGDGDHYRAIVRSDAFEGKSRVMQHQMVFAALKGRMGVDLHALALETGPRRSSRP